MQKFNLILLCKRSCFFLILLVSFFACDKERQTQNTQDLPTESLHNVQGAHESKKSKNYVHVRAKTLKLLRIDQKISVGARLESTAVVDVPVQTAGVITRIYVQEGQRVKKEEKLLHVDASRFGVSYRPSPIRAPIEGIVSGLPVKMGNKVSAGTIVATVASTDAYKVSAAVPLPYTHLVRRGTRGIFTPFALPKQTLPLIVREVSPKINATTGSTDITLDFEKVVDTSAFIIGMYGKLELLLKTYEGQIVIERHAMVLRRNEKGMLVLGVFRLHEPQKHKSKVEFVPITTGVEELEKLQIVEGLKENDVIVTIGQTHLFNEDTVVVLELDGIQRNISPSVFE